MFKKYFLFLILIFYLIKIKALPPPLNKNKIKKSTEKEYYEENPEIPPTRECPPYLEKYCYHGGTCFAAHVGNGNYRASCRCKPGWRDPRCLHLIDLGLYDIF